MKKLVAILLGTLMLALPVLALADGELTVIGTAAVTLVPDMAELSVGVETRADAVLDAVTGNSEALNAVIEALIAAGVARSDLATRSYYVSANYDYMTSPAVLTGYSVSNTLTVIVRDIEQIGAVIDAATAAGANQVYGVTFLSSQENEAHDRALAQAIQEGMRKAQLMAIAAGRGLGQLTAIEENGLMAYGVTVAYDTAGKGSGTAIMPEELSVTASVTLTYELR